MPELKSKAEIIRRLQAERRRLEKNLSLLGRKDMLRRGVVGDSSVKDILAHLADWEARMPVWMEAARRGDPVESPDPGLTWKQLDLLNERIYKAHSNRSLDDVLEYFHSVHKRFMDMVEAMPEEEMLTPGRYPFVGKGSVYGWLKAYANHDLWGKTKIRAWAQSRKNLGKKSRKK